MLLDPSEPPEPPDPKTRNEITWTTPALASFWNFLLSVRDRNTVGPVGLSFHVSPYFSSNSQLTYTELSGMGAQPLSQDPAAAAGASYSMAFSARRLNVPLTLVDHIKVYHNAADSMRFRSILDAWRFEMGGNKIRLLRGARFALLDERSKGVLVS